MTVTTRNILLLSLVTYLMYKASNKLSDLVNNIVVGTPRIKSFALISGVNIFSIHSFSDFSTSISEIFSAVTWADILSLNFPKIGFRFDLLLPLTNNNSFDIPSNQYAGTMSIDGNPIGQFSYAPVDIPANTTVDLKTNITSSLSNSFGLVKSIYQNVNIIQKGIDMKGTFTSNGVSVPYNTNAKIF